LAIPRIAPVNLHASLLPAYRGASPITAAILNGDAETGVSLMVMERSLDSGPVIAKRAIPIMPTATTESLTEELANVGAALLIDEIGSFVTGELQPVPQPNEGVSLVRPLTKADGEIDWTRSAEEIERHVRAMWSWPRAWARLGETTLQIHAASIVEISGLGAGAVEIAAGKVLVGTGGGALALALVQFPGKNPMDSRALANSGRITTGDRFAVDLPPRPPIVTRLDSDSSTSV
jgi:methionyl-tRNA formyltransferase